MAASFKFDTAKLNWVHFEGNPRFDYPINYDLAILGSQVEIGALDFIMRWPPNSFCHFHRHLAATTTLVLEGEQNLFETNDDGATTHTIRKAGDYARSSGGDVHMERAGKNGALVFFGMQSRDGRLFETLDETHNVLATVTVEDWAAGRMAGAR
ncbi:MAG: hypothetical protein HOA21_13725 [Rhodospirillaceae bacterium]|jgi:hypothetical protein|nr:hypothetical protein [Rhodospirillaceae bacterium]